MCFIFFRGRLWSEFTSTLTLIKQAEETCSKDINNQLIAQKTCFPILTNKRILIKVDSVKVSALDTLSPLLVTGKVDKISRIMVFCSPTAAIASKMKQNPLLVAPGTNYWIKGEFSEFDSGRYLDFFSIKKCEIEI